jgi:hypothetical protein
MENPDTVEQILSFLEDYAGHELGTRRLLASLFNYISATGDIRTIDDLTFHAKYVTGLVSSLNRQPELSQHTSHLGNEISTAIKQFRSMVANFVCSLPTETKTLFHKELLDMSGPSFQRLVAFAADLTVLKNLELDFAQFEASKETHVTDDPDS